MNETSTATEKTFSAKFSGTCSKCGDEIMVGETIKKDYSGEKPAYVHSSCKPAGTPGAVVVEHDGKDKVIDGKRTRLCRRARACKCCGETIQKGERTTPWVDGPKPAFGNATTWWVHMDCNETREQLVKREAADKQYRETLNTTPREFADREDVKKIVRDCIATLNFSNLENKINNVIKAEIESLEERLNVPRQVEVVRVDGTTKVLSGFVHEAFDEVLALASMRKNIFLPGPAGCGKTHMCGQVADALGLDFGFISCSERMSEGQVTGRFVPTGDSGKFQYVSTQFVDCYENGGVFLCDEVDAADPNVLLVINAALANGILALPNRVENPIAKKHEDFVFMSAGNTFGSGADRMYVGRNELDAATLDRFLVGTVPMDYDANLDAMVCPDSDLRGYLLNVRRLSNQAGLRRLVSTRFLKDAFDMVNAGLWDLNRVKKALFAAWTDDEKRKVGE
jgi:cobaltochelatase CobS